MKSIIYTLLASCLITIITGNPRIQTPQKPSKNDIVCTVMALGNKKDDTPQLLKAFNDCNNGGTIIFPEDQNYWIATKMNPIIHDVSIEWRGIWTVSDNLTHWRANSYPIYYQNHHTSFIITGSNIHINGFNTGGINGNGNAWYDAEKTATQPGRIMPLNFWNVTEVLVENFKVKDSPLWAMNVMNGTNMHFENITCNSTALSVPYGTNWVQNTDGFDTMDSRNISLTNFYFQGGDDCVAIKPRSYDIYIQNVTCHGGNGIAVGSLGQYQEDCSVVGVEFRDVKIVRYNEDMHNSAYIKTWMGASVPQNNYESGGLPRGGGWGNVSNILFQNFHLTGANSGPNINQNSGDNGSFAGTSKMLVSNVTYRNWRGYTQGGATAGVSCSKVHPCYGIKFDDVELASGVNGAEVAPQGTCTYVAKGGVVGMSGKGC